MTRALIFISGCLMTSLIFWKFSPPCALAAWFAGFACAVIAMGITLFVEAGLDYLGDKR